MNETWSPFRFESSTGANLRVFSLISNKEKPKGVVHINHGMAEHAARYETFAKELAKAGYHAYAHEHRGHGETTAPDAPMGNFSNHEGWEKVIEDVNSVNAHIQTQHPDLPIIYFGHSMGAIIGLNYCMMHSNTLQAAALWNSGADGGILLFVYRVLLKIERMFKGSDVPSGVAMKLTFEDWNRKFAPNRTPCDWLSRDETEVDKYVADPLCGFATTTGLWLDVLKGIKNGNRNDELAKIRKNLPMFLLGGGADPCTNKGQAMTRLAHRLERTGIEDLRCKILPDTRHESLNEINRNETIASFIKWLDDRFED